MLSFAIATFFALSLMGALLVIGMMFSSYRERIAQVVLDGLGRKAAGSVTITPRYQHHTIKPRQMVLQHRTMRTAPLRAAA